MGSICSSTPLQLLLNKFGIRTLFLFLTFLLLAIGIILVFFSCKDKYCPNLDKDISVGTQLKNASKALFSDRQLINGFFLFILVNGLFNAYQGLWCASWAQAAFPATTNLATVPAIVLSIGVMIGCFFNDKLIIHKNNRMIAIINLSIISAVSYLFLCFYRLLGSSIYVSMIADFIMGMAIGNICVQTTALIRERSSRENNSNMMGITNAGASIMSQTFQWISGLLIDIFLLSNTANFSFSISFALMGIPFFVSIAAAGLSTNKNHKEINPIGQE